MVGIVVGVGFVLTASFLGFLAGLAVRRDREEFIDVGLGLVLCRTRTLRLGMYVPVHSETVRTLN